MSHPGHAEGGTPVIRHLLAEAGVPTSRIYQSRDMSDDPHFRAREAIVRLTHDRLGPFPVQAVVPRCLIPACSA